MCAAWADIFVLVWLRKRAKIQRLLIYCHYSKSLKYISTGSYQPYQGSILNFSMEINVLLNDVQAISYYSSISF